MRIKSDVLISALLRQVSAQGGFATIVHKGAAEAGAIFLQARQRDGSYALYGPAPQALVESGRDDAGLRHLELRLEDASGAEIDSKMAGERRFDPDLWLVEIEDVKPQTVLSDLAIIIPPTDFGT